jgi:hypothetical protein
MPDQPSPPELHEQFVADCREIDLAWKDGRLDEWIQEKLADDRNDAESR